MKALNVVAGVCGLAALFCGCTKNDPAQEPEKEPVAVEEVKLDAAVRIPRGGEKQLVAVVLPEDATYEAVQWTSDDETVAKVDEKGLVKAVGRGEATVKATVGEKSAECVVTVYVAVSGISLDKTELELSVGGTSVKLAVDFEPFGVDESEKVVTWTSSKPEVATVSEDGTVAPVAEGETTVTAECSGYKAECKVTVIKPAKVWTVGEYYDVDGVQGVVCWVSDDSQHGKIVSLDEKHYCVWATETTITGAQSETDGKLNTEKIKDSNPTFRGYDSFKWCVEHGDGWYFPACYEVEAFVIVKDALNKTIKEHGGEQISDPYYWTSTEAEGEDGELMALQTELKLKADGTATSPGYFKDDDEFSGCVRAMYEF